MSKEIPEGCKLIAHYKGDGWGDGWYLAVQDTKANEIAILAWPEPWPEKMTSDELEFFGFEII